MFFFEKKIPHFLVSPVYLYFFQRLKKKLKLWLYSCRFAKLELNWFLSYSCADFRIFLGLVPSSQKTLICCHVWKKTNETIVNCTDFGCKIKLGTCGREAIGAGDSDWCVKHTQRANKSTWTGPLSSFLFQATREIKTFLNMWAIRQPSAFFFPVDFEFLFHRVFSLCCLSSVGPPVSVWRTNISAFHVPIGPLSYRNREAPARRSRQPAATAAVKWKIKKRKRKLGKIW